MCFKNDKMRLNSSEWTWTRHFSVLQLQGLQFHTGLSALDIS